MTEKQKAKASILRSDKPGYVKLVTPFNRDFVDDFKSTIPPGQRKWDAVEKVWIVSDTYLEDITDMLNKYFDEVSNDLVDLVEDQKEGSQSDPYAVMSLLPGAPDELVDAAYRLFSVSWRPGKGGSENKMKALNKAYEQIKKERRIS